MAVKNYSSEELQNLTSVELIKLNNQIYADFEANKKKIAEVVGPLLDEQDRLDGLNHEIIRVLASRKTPVPAGNI